MEIQIYKSLAIRSALALAMAFTAGSSAFAQSSEPAKAKKMTMDHAKMGHPKIDHAKMMVDRCQGMMAEMKTQDAQLAQQVARMNSATKEAKLELMAEIITQMSDQRTAMNAKMAGMHLEMMRHMQMGMGSMSHHSKMKGMDKKSGDMQKDAK